MGNANRYDHALRILGGDDPLVKAMETLLTIGTLGWWELIDAKNELVKTGNRLLGQWRDWRAEKNWNSRTERIEAAHTILVVTSFFDAVDDLQLPLSRGGAKSLRRDLEPPTERRMRAIHRHATLTLSEITIDLCPSPQHPYEDTRKKIKEFYQSLSRGLLKYLRGLAIHDRLAPHEWDAVRSQVASLLPDKAAARYEDNYRRLSVDVQEFAMWANMIDHQATRNGLAELERLLRRIPTGSPLPEQLDTLRRVHRSALDHAVAEAGQRLPGMQIPTLREAYITQRFRVAEYGVKNLETQGSNDNPSIESWWHEKKIRDDLEGFLAGHLTRSTASRTPLIVLGQPGAGKSVLCKVLGAQLPDCFLPVRVPLSEVSAGDGIQEQIEKAIEKAIGEALPWQQLLRAAKDVMPVVILDGFDELLQATGVRQSDYLAKVVSFQQLQIDRGHPVAVIVTTRTALAHCAKMPMGAVVVRLEPFDEQQIARWLNVWNQANASYFREHGLRPLGLPLTLNHRSMAEQPLLLLMLALYDADGNRLRGTGSRFSQLDLYEKLITRFVERDLQKVSDADPAEVEHELRKLATASFSMFNRRRQWAASKEVEDDFGALFFARAPQGSFATPLRPGEQVFGRFFFIYEATANRDADTLHTYEFLHATFGEFLIAWLIANVLDEMAHSHRRTYLGLNDDLLRALLSWAALSARSALILFLREFTLKRKKADEWYEMLQDIIRSLETRPDTSMISYQPRRAGPARKYAYYSMNLITLALICKERLYVSDLLPSEADTLKEWQSYYFLWWSQCDTEEFENQMHLVAPIPVKSDGQPDVRLRLPPVAQPDTSGIRLGLAVSMGMFMQPPPLSNLDDEDGSRL